MSDTEGSRHRALSILENAGLWLLGPASRLWPFVVVALIFGIINATLRPLTKLLTCPIILLTLGLFALVVNGLMLWLTSTVADSLGIGFRVNGFWPAFWGALVVSIVSTLLSMSVRAGEVQERRF